MCTNLTDIPWTACQVTQQAWAAVSEFWSQQPLEFCHQEVNQDIGNVENLGAKDKSEGKLE